MKAYFIYIIIFIWAIFGLQSCKEEDEPWNNPDPDPEVYESVAILYYIADNNLNSYSDKDIAELVDGKDNIPANSKVVVYVDKSNAKPVIYQIDAKKGKQEWKKYEEEEDCTDSLNMLNTLRSIVRGFPAKRYGLSFGSHGSGWTMKRKAIGMDDSHRSNWMDIPTLRGVLEQLPHMQYIFFDVCFMQSIEVAYELRKVTDWVVASPAEIPIPGAPYHMIVGGMCSGNVQDIIQGYSTYYPVTYDGYHFPGVILSAIQTSELESLAKATSRITNKNYAGQSTKTISTEVQRYSSSYSSYTFCFDMNSLMFNISTSDDYNEWLEVFDKAVPMKEQGTGSWKAEFCSRPYIYDALHFGGVTMFVPENNYESKAKMEDLHKFQWYKDAGWDKTGW